MDTQTLIITIITSLLGGSAVSALVSGIMARRKTQAEAKSIDRTVEQKAIEQAEKTYKNVIKTLEEQLSSQALRIAALEAETAEQESKIELLITQLGQLREVNASLLEKNAELQRQVKEHEDFDKLFGERKQNE